MRAENAAADIELENTGRGHAVGREGMERVEQVAGLASPQIDDIALAQTARIPHPDPRRQFIAGRIVRAASHAETHGAFEFDGFEKPGVRPDQRAVDQRKIDARFEEHPHRYGIPYARRRIEQIALAGKLPCRAGRLLPGRASGSGNRTGHIRRRAVMSGGRGMPARRRRVFRRRSQHRRGDGDEQQQHDGSAVQHSQRKSMNSYPA